MSLSWSSSSTPAHAHVVLEDEVEEQALFGVERRVDVHLRARGPHLARDGRSRVGHVREHVEEVALLGVDDLLHLGQLLAAETSFGEPL